MSFLPQIGFFEILLLAVIALVVVGPQDLPRLMRGLGRATAKLRALSDEFRGAFDQMAREAEVEELRREIEALKSANPVKEVSEAFREAGEEAYAAMPETSAPGERTDG